MSEERFKIETNDDGTFRLVIDAVYANLTLPELKALHERLGEVLWDVSAGRIKMREGLEDGGETD